MKKIFKENKRKGWKVTIWEFFKPTKWKIILMVLLAPLLLVFINYQPLKYLLFLPIIFSGPFTTFSTGVGIVTLLGILVQLLTYLVEVYLISCLIFLIYDTIKNKFI